jgi:hypothetical protein
MKENPFATGVLDKAVHDRMVQDIHRYAGDACIEPRWIWTPLAVTCGDEEVAWTKRFKFHPREERAGLCYTGWKYFADIDARMSAIAGCLTRNFIRARVMQLNALMSELDDGEVPDMSCLLIPNFFVEKTLGGHQPRLNAGLLLGALMERARLGKQTVLYVSSFQHLKSDYGSGFSDLIRKRYALIEATN